MVNLQINSSDMSLDFNVAREMALACAAEHNMEQPVILSWRQHNSHGFAPGFEGAEEESWWSKYGQGNGGQANISVGDDYSFIVAESGGYETVNSLPLRNIRDANGTEYLCLTPMLDDTNTPRKDACSPLDDWTADQY